jgi:UvrB/uvrC motif
MSDSPQHLDELLAQWPYEFGEVSARVVDGADGREVLQLRVDLGLLQMETAGRPDGARPGGFATYYDYLISLAFQEGEAFELDESRCLEIDREFVQFFHRRIGWMAVRRFDEAAADADHTLALMDFTSAHATDESWVAMHEQYRPFVLFHRIQAAALARLQEEHPQEAVQQIEQGLDQIREIFAQHEALEQFDEDEVVVKLREMKETVVEHYEVRPSLTEQLADAIAAEQYELAAELRDQLERRNRPQF